MGGTSFLGLRGMLLAGAATFAISATVALAQVSINSVSIDGNQRIPDSTILSLLGLERGTVASDGEINDALQRILASGLF